MKTTILTACFVLTSLLVTAQKMEYKTGFFSTKYYQDGVNVTRPQYVKILETNAESRTALKKSRTAGAMLIVSSIITATGSILTLTDSKEIGYGLMGAGGSGMIISVLAQSKAEKTALDVFTGEPIKK